MASIKKPVTMTLKWAERFAKVTGHVMEQRCQKEIHADCPGEAKNLGIRMEDAFASVAALTKVGVKTDIAITQLRATMVTPQGTGG